MGRNNNNAGMHMIYWLKRKDDPGDYDADYYISKNKEYYSDEWRNYMDSTILSNTRAIGSKTTVICTRVGKDQTCACGGKLNRKRIIVRYRFEKGREMRKVDGYKCENCGNAYLVIGMILPVLKQDFYF